jgi:integrase/recombinase XerC/integrase/recombinase XerD
VLAAGAGARACEIAALERGDIRNAAIKPVIQLTGKGDKSRIVPLTPWVWGELQSHGLPKRGVMFRRYDGKPGPNRADLISHLTSEFFDSIGVDATIHMCRHRYATVALNSCGGKLRVVQELLGHADPATTAVYTAYMDEDAIEAALGTQPPTIRTVRAVGDDTQPTPIEEE